MCVSPTRRTWCGRADRAAQYLTVKQANLACGSAAVAEPAGPLLERQTHSGHSHFTSRLSAE